MQAYFLTIQNPHAHSQNRTILVLYRRYAANFAHMCGGWLYSSSLENKKTCCLHVSMTHQLFLFSIVLNSYYFFKLKKTACDRLPFRRRYFYYGVYQKLYNVLGGFYGYYNITVITISVHKLHKNRSLFLCNLYSTLVVFNIFHIVILHKSIVIF